MASLDIALKSVRITGLLLPALSLDWRSGGGPKQSMTMYYRRCELALL